MKTQPFTPEGEKKHRICSERMKKQRAASRSIVHPHIRNVNQLTFTVDLHMQCILVKGK